MIQQVIQLIDQHSDFDAEMAAALASPQGYCIKTSNAFVLCEYNELTQHLLVHFAHGELKALMKLTSVLPNEPITIAFEKHNKDKHYNYQRFINCIAKHK